MQVPDMMEEEFSFFEMHSGLGRSLLGEISHEIEVSAILDPSQAT